MGKCRRSWTGREALGRIMICATTAQARPHLRAGAPDAAWQTFAVHVTWAACLVLAPSLHFAPSGLMGGGKV